MPAGRNGLDASQGHLEQAMSKETLGWVIILTSPIWVPVAFALALIALPVVLLCLLVMVQIRRWYGI